MGRILSFETGGDQPCDPEGAKFLKEPFSERFTLANINELLTKLRNWTRAQELVSPKVAVAQVSGWTKNPAGSTGKDRAEKLYYDRIKKLDSGREFFYKDTALSSWQKSSLSEGYYEVVLYFVDLADRCE